MTVDKDALLKTVDKKDVKAALKERHQRVIGDCRLSGRDSGYSRL